MYMRKIRMTENKEIKKPNKQTNKQTKNINKNKNKLDTVIAHIQP